MGKQQANSFASAKLTFGQKLTVSLPWRILVAFHAKVAKMGSIVPIHKGFSIKTIAQTKPS